MSTWEDAHAGCLVLGHDGVLYRVTSHAPHPAGPIVTLRGAAGTVGPAQPPPNTPITIVETADMSAEAEAFATLAGAGLGPELIGETYA